MCRTDCTALAKKVDNVWRKYPAIKHLTAGPFSSYALRYLPENDGTRSLWYALTSTSRDAVNYLYMMRGNESPLSKW
jgi:hypothetical protein